MGRPVLKVKGYEPEAIKALFNENKDYKIGMKLYAVYQVALGKPSRELESVYQTSFKQITNWVHRFEQEGAAGLADKPGRGRKPRLSEDQRKQLETILLEKQPEDYGYNSATWTGPLLRDWIKSEFNVAYKHAQIYNIIKSLGFTYQKGKGIRPEADPEKQDQFKKNLKKKLLESSLGTELIFEDECSFSNTATIGYGWSKKGTQPHIPCKQRNKERQTLFGSYNYGTGQMTVSFEDKGNTETFKKHLKKVCCKYRGSPKIIMVLDNVRFHHAKKIQAWLSTQERLELVFLPPYSPELNAVERAWWYMRKKITHNRYVKTIEERKIEFWKLFSHFEKPNDKLKNICVINY